MGQGSGLDSLPPWLRLSVARAGREASGLLHPKPAIRGAHGPPERPDGRRQPPGCRGDDGRASCDAYWRTPLGLGGSNGKPVPAGDGRSLGPSRGPGCARLDDPDGGLHGPPFIPDPASHHRPPIPPARSPRDHRPPRHKGTVIHDLNHGSCGEQFFSCLGYGFRLAGPKTQTFTSRTSCVATTLA